jgi:GNAT superfamily N-acetyltransferase
MIPVLRDARLEDIETVRAIERASSRRFIGLMDDLAEDDPTPAPVLAARIAAGGLLTASLDQTLAAFVMFRPVEDGLYIEQIDVLPAFAGQRIGAGLLDAVADRARAGGLTALTLSTFRDVPWNAPWYRRLGFIDIADAALTPGLLKIRQEHLARGLDESQRTFMRRPL